MKSKLAIIIKAIKAILKIIFLRRKPSSGEIASTNIKKILATIIDESITDVKTVLIFSFLRFEDGRYLISPTFKPRSESPVMTPITLINAVASPISSVEKSLVLIIQKKNPNPVTMMEFSIK
tara:strand:+ start:852 stop:1217 length:366 start_codon:yes stop_codon:yes gene_type:complete